MATKQSGSQQTGTPTSLSSPSLIAGTLPITTPKLPLTTPVLSATNILTLSKQLSACLPTKSTTEIKEPIWAAKIYEQARSRGDLPSKGEGTQWQISYDNKVLLMAWVWSSGTYDLVAYNLDDRSLRTIAHLFDLQWQVSQVSDCIIVFGVPTGEEKKYSRTNPISNYMIIDSRGNRYKFEVAPNQLEPDFVLDLAWSPDGLQIAVITVTRPPGQMSLYLISVDGQRVHPLLFNIPKTELIPKKMSWSPTGQQIALIGSHSEGKTEKEGLLLVDVNTGQQEWVVKEGVKNTAGSMYWSPDGDHLYYPAPSCYQLIVATREIKKADEKACAPYGPPEARP